MARGGENNRMGMMRSMNSTGVPMEGVKFTSQDGGNNRVRLGDISNVVGGARKMDEKNPHGFVGRRPMTRKFAASLAGKSQDTIAGEGHTEISRSNCSSPVGLDDYESDYDFPLAMIEEIEEMINIEHEEVEMEDLEMDIDSCDSKDPLAVVDYVDDIYRFFRRTEDLGCVSPNYMATQFDINEKMRGILIDWLIEVHYKFELMEETLFLTVNIIDRFLARQTVARKKLQLVGVTALLLACKYEEVSIPVIEDLIVISDRAYTRTEVLEMEKLIVITLHFNMSVPTPYVFMRRFLKAAQSDEKLELLSLFIIELCLVEYEMLKFRPSFLAAAAVYTAQCTLKGFKNWTRTSELHTTYAEEHLLECSRMMVGFHSKAGTQKLTSVHRKYNTLKSGYTARTEPALFLLDEGLQQHGSAQISEFINKA